LSAYKYEEEVGTIPDTFGPLSQSGKTIHYLSVPNDLNIHLIDSEDKLNLLDDLSDEPLGIDSEWRPTLNVFH